MTFTLVATMVNERDPWEIEPLPRPKENKDTTLQSNQLYSTGSTSFFFTNSGPGCSSYSGQPNSGAGCSSYSAQPNSQCYGMSHNSSYSVGESQISLTSSMTSCDIAFPLIRDTDAQKPCHDI